jgi:hypothetical protein
LLDYVVEQSKVVDRHRFNLSGCTGFQKDRSALACLPGVDFDLQTAGDHAWLRVERLRALLPPDLPAPLLGLVQVSRDPSSPPPRLKDLSSRATAVVSSASPHTSKGELALRGEHPVALRDHGLDMMLADYIAQWTAWAAAESPRRQTISLYADLFSLKHRLAAEGTGRAQELIWGMGVSAWTLRDELGLPVDVQYPLLTQAMDIAVEEGSLAIVLRPRGVPTRLEFDAFSGWQLPSLSRSPIGFALTMKPHALASRAEFQFLASSRWFRFVPFHSPFSRSQPPARCAPAAADPPASRPRCLTFLHQRSLPRRRLSTGSWV